MGNNAEYCPLAKIDRLLLATDRSPYSEGAVREAIHLATKCRSRLYVMSVLETNPEYETIGANAYEKEEEEATHYLHEIKSRATAEGVYHCETMLHYGEETCQLIIDEAYDRHADMIIIGRRGRSALMNVLMGGVATRVISHAPCKVLVVPKAAHIECKTILVATDGSAHSIAAATEAIEMAKRCGSHLVAVSAVSRPDQQGEARMHVDSVREAAKKEGLSVDAVTPAGKPNDVIIETAGGMGVDLIVIGTYGKTGLKKLLMGSATEKVISHAGCGVLVVRATQAVRGTCATDQAA
jgi:nucleotide-binding universal stress UspA family protein